MPEKILCHRCSYILYHGREPVLPGDVVKKYNRCPRCLTKLSKNPVKVMIEIKGGR